MDNFRTSDFSGIQIFYKVRTVLWPPLPLSDACKIVHPRRHSAFRRDNYWSQAINLKPLPSNFLGSMVSAHDRGTEWHLRCLVARSDSVLGVCLLRTTVVALHRLQYCLSHLESGGNARRDYDSVSADSVDCKPSITTAG